MPRLVLVVALLAACAPPTPRIDPPAGDDAGACAPAEACTCPEGTPSTTDCAGACVCWQCDGACAYAACEDAGQTLCGAAPDAGAAVLHCRGGAYALVFACPSPQYCSDVPANDSVYCGADGGFVQQAPVDAGCAVENGVACTFDRAALLTCRAGAWSTTESCSAGGLTCGTAAPGETTERYTCPTTSINGCTVCK